jgi:hypothetical protein
LEKIKKEDWDKLSKSDQDYLTFEFNKEVEKRRVLGLYVTRIIALACVCALVWVGFVQYFALQSYNGVIADYGALGYCYLCGEQTLKQCSCQYNFGLQDIDLVLLSNITAHNNAAPCVDELGKGISYLIDTNITFKS